MNIKKLLISGIVAGILFFLLGWLIYGILLMDYMSHNTGKAGHVIERKEMEYAFLFFGNLLQGFLLAYIFIKANVNTLMAGLVTGAILGLLISSAVDCIMYGTTFVLSKRGMMADVISFTIISALIGAVLGAIGGNDKK
jgi:hypothetical protein